MASPISMINSNSPIDKLTSEIFSILENKFLFGYDNQTCIKQSPMDQVSVPMEELKSGRHVTGKVRVLSIDGGGATDGVFAATSIVRLESFLRRKSGISDARISDFFDVVSGSGIGGVLAALLFTKGKDGEPVFTAEAALRFVVENGHSLSRVNRGFFRKVFGGPVKAKGSKVFRRVFNDLSLKDTLKAVLIPCYDLNTGAPFVFSRADAVEMEGCDFKMSDVCAATTAVNGAVETVSVDRRTKISALTGELAMNNPTAMAITHILNNKQEFPFCNTVDDLLVVSLGNGEPSCVAGNHTPSRAALLKIAGETVSDTVDQAVSMAFGQCRSSNYARVQGNKGFVDSEKPKQEKESNILKTSEQMLRQKNVESVLFQGRKCNKTNIDKLDLFATEIIKETENRKLNILPTVVLRQTTTSSSPRTSSATTLSITSSN